MPRRKCGSISQTRDAETKVGGGVYHIPNNAENTVCECKFIPNNAKSRRVDVNNIQTNARRGCVELFTHQTSARK